MRLLKDDFLTDGTWQPWLDELAARHQVPGVQVGLVTVEPDGSVESRILVTGVTSTAAGAEVTSDTVFQIGSITKVWTATLIMQLVDEGRLDLDARVVDLLPTFTLADPALAPAVTVRHLLTHTSGIDGDLFTDTGDGDDCLTRYVDELRTASSVTRPGGHLSYCNSGFVVAGRIIEVLTGRSWDDALADRLLRPLQLDHTLTRTEDARRFRAAVGHLRISPDSSTVRPATTSSLPRSIGPAGLISASIVDLLAFAAAHLRDGRGPEDSRILSAESAQAMRARQVDLSADSTMQPGWGLGWCLRAWGDQTAAAHDGATIGQISDLQLFPERRLALAVLTNARSGAALIDAVHDDLGTELGLTPPAPSVDPEARFEDLRPLLGTWESTSTRWTLESGRDGIVLHTGSKHPADDEPDPVPQVITPAGLGRFLIDLDGAPLEVSYVHDDGRDYLYSGRLLERAPELTR